MLLQTDTHTQGSGAAYLLAARGKNNRGHDTLRFA